MSAKNNIFNRLSLVPAGLRYKLMIVFCLMSVIPLLICTYIAVNFVFPITGWAVSSLSLVLLITLIIALLGFILAKRMVEPIIDMALEARLIAGGDFERSIEITGEGEVGDLAHSLNIMTERIRDNITELKSYGEKTREINAEIHKKVMVLSGLLQVGNLISAGSDLKTVLDILAEKVALIDGTNPAVMIMQMDDDEEHLTPVSTQNLKSVEAADMPVSIKHNIFSRLRTEPGDIIMDKRLAKEDSLIAKFKESYKIKNGIIVSINVRGKLEGVIFFGNNEDNYQYRADDIELLHVFCKQAAIAIENDQLIKKTEALEVKDDLTQLYNNKYIKDRLDEEIKRAILYQRPCSFILFNVDNFKEFCHKYGRMKGEAALRKIAHLISSELTPVDRAGRFSDDEFAMVLPERSKKETKQIADDIRKKIAELIILPEAQGPDKHLTVSGSLSENPIDGVSANELIGKAQGLLQEAKASGKNTVKA